MTHTKPTTTGRTACRIALLAIAGAAAAQPAATNAATEADAGKQIFQQKCSGCHTVGGGPLVGPDLKGVTALRPRAWLEHWIAAPDQVLAQKDPVAVGLLHQFHDVPMPNLGLSATDIAAVLAYLETTAPGAAPAAAATAAASAAAATAAAPAPVPAGAAALPGDAEVGKELFTGTLRFRNGGPPCMACHSVAGIGALGGGQLGPDLTTVVTRYGGPVALSAFVGASPTPTMNAVWSRTPLTAQERANVVAFLSQAALTQRPAQAIWQLALLALVGFVILLAIGGWVWRARLRDGVRRPMIERTAQAARQRAGANVARRG